jgi:hypothetical protein
MKYVVEDKEVKEVPQEKALMVNEERVEIDELKPKEVLSVLMRRGWTLKQMIPIRRELSKVGREIWKPRIEEALRETGYAKRLKEEAERINLSEEVKKAWK